MKDTSDTPKPRKEPDIILVGLERKAYYLVKGESYLNQLLLSDGEYPKPVLCVHFENLFDCKRMLKDFSPATAWSIHPEIVDRLRDTKCLVETDA